MDYFVFLGFECRCGGLFCAVHRYSDKHDCSFNYREMGAQEIRRNNPVVVGEKIQKIWTPPLKCPHSTQWLDTLWMWHSVKKWVFLSYHIQSVSWIVITKQYFIKIIATKILCNLVIILNHNKFIGMSYFSFLCCVYSLFFLFFLAFSLGCKSVNYL